MPLELTPDLLAQLAPDSLLSGALAAVADETAPILDAAKPATAPVQPVTRIKHTPTYDALRGFLTVSAALHDGTPNVARVAGGYIIRVGAALAVGVTITEPLATILSWHLRDAKTNAWRVVETKRMPKLAPKELLSLFVTGKELP